MITALRVVTFDRPLTGKELKARLELLCASSADWTVQTSEALLGEGCVHTLGTRPQRQTPDPCNDRRLSTQELAKCTIITPKCPGFCWLQRAGFYFTPDSSYSRVYLWSYQRSILTPPPDRCAAELFVQHLACKLSGRQL